MSKTHPKDRKRIALSNRVRSAVRLYNELRSKENFDLLTKAIKDRDQYDNGTPNPAAN